MDTATSTPCARRRRRHWRAALSPALGRGGRRAGRQRHGSARCHDRQRRRPLDPSRPRRRRGDTAVAERRLHPGVRRAADRRRAARRHLRPPPAVSRRLGGLHAVLRRFGSRADHRRAHRLPRPAGGLRGADDPPGLRLDEAGLRRRRRTGQGIGSVRSGDGRADARRADPRRRAHRRQPLGYRVASGVPHQRPDRRGDAASRDPFAAPRRHSSRRQARHRWRRARRPGAGRDHLPTHPGSDRRLARLVLRDARGRRGPARSSSCATSDAAATTR